MSLENNLYNGQYRPSLTNIIGQRFKVPDQNSAAYRGPSSITATGMAELNADSLRIANNNNTLNHLGINPKSSSYVDNMQLGDDGKIYNTGLNDQVNDAIAEKGFQAGPTIENTKLLNRTDTDADWDYKDWGTAGGIGLGIGQLGLGVMSYLDQSKTADKQRKLLDQQYDNNADLISARKAKRTNISQAFGG